MQTNAKRILDLAVSCTLLSILTPVWTLTALAVRLRLGAPVLFTQIRPGLGGRPFKLYKFRTMNEARDENGNLLSDHLRLTPFGRFLRLTSLDEIPQLLNVIRGEMSLVGPRPLLLEYIPFYNTEQLRRHEVPPGITGWAQINGRNAISWEEKFQLDVWYVDNQSMRLDLYILYRTFLKALRPEGINAASDTTMPRFDKQERKP